MNLNERQMEILGLLYKDKRISVAELSRILYVTQMTVRRDLKEMETGGYIKRYHGGAVLAQCEDFPIDQRMSVDETEKFELAKRAACFLQDNTTVFIDSSSTSHYLIPHLKKKENIKIITNSIHALSLSAGLHLPCFLIGGEYCESEMCCIGPFAEKFASQLNIDIAFLSTLGITCDGKITDSSPAVTAVKEYILRNAKNTVFMFEHSKIDKVGLYTVCHKDDPRVTVLISD